VRLKRYGRYHEPQRAGSQEPAKTLASAPDAASAGILPWSIQRLEAGHAHRVKGGVVIEEPLEIRLNDHRVAVLMRTPGFEKELAAGFCLGEGLVRDLKDIALVRHCGHSGPGHPSDHLAEGDALDVSRNRVDVTLMPGVAVAPTTDESVPLIRSGCGRSGVNALVEHLRPVDGDHSVPMELLRRLPAQITRQQSAYRLAGGIHAAALFDRGGQTIIVCEDVGRHNAVDKAVGYCLLRGISLTDKMLVSTGRASYDMVAKGVRLGVPIIASISSPTSLAVELAEALNCTLLGYLRGKTLNVYSHGWRVRT
jgi:FdhD protein